MYQVIVSDYGATGEGRTVCILITRAYPEARDYENNVVVNTAEFRAIRDFKEAFDPFWFNFAQNISVDDLLEHYKVFLPDMVRKVLTAGETSIPGNFHFTQQYHVNYS